MIGTPAIDDRVTLLGRRGVWVVIDVDPERRTALVIPEADCWCRDYRRVKLEHIEPAP